MKPNQEYPRCRIEIEKLLKERGLTLEELLKLDILSIRMKLQAQKMLRELMGS